MTYRPITDVWILARPKVKFYGAYPNGFLVRARALLGASIYDPVLHVCAGAVRDYPVKGGFGPNDLTMDIDDRHHPDFLMDAREPFPEAVIKAVLIDPPYDVGEARHYQTEGVFPSANLLLKNGLAALPVGGRVGILHWTWPSPPKSIPTKLIAAIAVLMGYNNRIRLYSVYEKVAETPGGLKIEGVAK